MKLTARQILGLILVFVIILGVMQFSLQSFRVEGASMEPSFHDDQYLLVDKLSYRFRSPHRGDVIVFHNPRFPDEPALIKRIIGLPGEKLEIRAGDIYINGVEVQETPDFPAVPRLDEYSVTIPPEHYFVLGDNRSNSSGSHIFGPVPRDNIVGKVWLYYWPPSDWGLSPKYSADLEPVTTASIQHR